MDSDRLVDWLLALSIGGVLVEIVRSYFQRRKMNADYANVIASSAIQLLQPLENRIKELEEQLQSTKRALVETRHELTEARREVRTLSRRLLEYESEGRNPHE